MLPMKSFRSCHPCTSPAITIGTTTIPRAWAAHREDGTRSAKARKAAAAGGWLLVVRCGYQD